MAYSVLIFNSLLWDEFLISIRNLDVTWHSPRRELSRLVEPKRLYEKKLSRLPVLLELSRSPRRVRDPDVNSWLISWKFPRSIEGTMDVTNWVQTSNLDLLFISNVSGSFNTLSRSRKWESSQTEKIWVSKLQIPLWNAPAGNGDHISCIHQNKYPAKDDEYNYHDSFQAYL